MNDQARHDLTVSFLQSTHGLTRESSREANQAMIALSEAEILDLEQRIEGLKEIIRRCQVANSARH